MRRLSVRAIARAERLILLSLLSLLLGFLVMVQLRSQAELARTLENQDNTSVALLINDLNQANNGLLQQTVALAQRQQALEQGLTAGGADARAIEKELTVLREVGGRLPVHGPGIEIRIDGPVMDFELQDALNNLRNAGAEAFALNGYRIVNGTPVTNRDGVLQVAGGRVSSPYILKVVGDPGQLAGAADLASGSLQTRVQVHVERKADVVITEVLPSRPLLYAQRGS